MHVGVPTIHKSKGFASLKSTRPGTFKDLSIMNKYEKLFLLLSGIFIACLIIANALVFKLFDVPLPVIGQVTLVMGILPYPITFLVTDLVSELYGKARANFLVFVGFVVSLLFLGIIQLAYAIPVSHLQDAETIQGHFGAVFGQSVRAIFGSMVAYLVAQFLDVQIFHYLKKLTKGKHLWLRNNGSTLISQLVDTTLVTTILFYDNPDISIPALIAAGYAFKLLVALIDTPLIYLGVYLFEDVTSDEGRKPHHVEV
jgi:uncharacterized integral membrane protein (TIGR00697 family)